MFSIGIVSVMKLPVYNLVIRIHKYDDDARGDADDVHLHKHPDDDGANTIKHKHNNDDHGNFYDNDGDDDDKEEDDNDDNAANDDGRVNDDDDNVKFSKDLLNSSVFLVPNTI